MTRTPRKSPAAERLMIGATAPPPRPNAVGVGTRQGRVVLSMPEPTRWIALDKRTALQLALQIIERAARLPEEPKP